MKRALLLCYVRMSLSRRSVFGLRSDAFELPTANALLSEYWPDNCVRDVNNNIPTAPPPSLHVNSILRLQSFFSLRALLCFASNATRKVRVGSARRCIERSVGEASRFKERHERVDALSRTSSWGPEARPSGCIGDKWPRRTAITCACGTRPAAHSDGR